MESEKIIKAVLSEDEIAAKLDEISLKYLGKGYGCLLYTSPSPRDGLLSRMPSSA